MTDGEHGEIEARDEAYRVFITDAISTGCVWGLESSEGWALCPSTSNVDIDVMPLWSQPEYARAHCRDEWANYKEIPIALDELLDDWLPGMHQDILLVGINWNESLEGDEVEPLDLLEDIDNAINGS